MSFQPVFVNVRASASASAEVNADVEGVPPLPYPGGSLQPDHIRVVYVFDPATGRWVHSAKVTGRRYLLSGALGRAPMYTTLWHEDERSPQWVRDFVAANEPSALPYIPAVSA